MADIDKENEPPLFSIHRIYTKEISFTSPKMPQAFSFEWKPDLKYTVEVASSEISPDIYEVILGFKLIVNLKVKKEKVKACEFKMIQAGLFTVSNVSEEEKGYALLVRAPETLYPYIQETATSSINKAGFPQVTLPIINFAEGLPK